MAALVVDVADPAGQTDERGVQRPHVPDPQLRLGHVQDRVPVRMREGDERDDERDRQEDPQRDEDPAATGLQPRLEGVRSRFGGPPGRRPDLGRHRHPARVHASVTRSLGTGVGGPPGAAGIVAPS